MKLLINKIVSYQPYFIHYLADQAPAWLRKQPVVFGNEVENTCIRHFCLDTSIKPVKNFIIALMFQSLTLISLIFISLIQLSFPSRLYGQFEATVGYGMVGEKICISISFPRIITLDTIAISGDFHLSNPTVFYPENFTIPDNYSMIESSITRLSDSTYTFTLSFQINGIINDSAEFFFCGEALAGSDSLCIITFSGLTLNDEPVRDFEAIVKVNTIAGTIPYIQFPRITNIYSNPARAGESFTVQFYSYKKSDIKFYILNVARQEELIESIESVGQGTHEFTYRPGRGFAAGAYWILMITNTGFDVKGVIIIK